MSNPPNESCQVALGGRPGVFGLLVFIKNLPASIAGCIRPYRLLLRFPLLVAVAFVACGWSQAEPWSAEPPLVKGPLFHEATNEFKAMKTTRYQHQTRVDRAAGSYRYDCVGFVSYALKQAAPEAWAAAVKATGIPKGRIPSPARYRAFLAFLAALVEKPKPGWEAVRKVSDLRPGDVVAWEHKTESSSGHAVIIAGVPVCGVDGSWSVEVYDSTSSPHGADDSRRSDKRAQVLEATGRPSGLGHGVMAFVADPVSGSLIGLRWSPKGKRLLAPIAAGRPTS